MGMLAYEVRDGRFFFCSENDAVRLEGLRPNVHYRVDGTPQVFRPPVERTSEGACSAVEQHGLFLSFRVRRQEPFLVVDACLTHRGKQAVRLESVAPLWLSDFGAVHIGRSAKDWSVFRNGYQSWTGTGSFRANEVDPNPFSRLLQIGLIDVARPSPAIPGHFRSELFTAITNRSSRETLIVGFLDGRFAFADIEVAIVGERCKRWAATVHYDGKPLAPGQTIVVPALALAHVADAYEGLAAYAYLSGRTMHARVAQKNPIGWCSWYEYFTEIDEEAIRENIDAAQRLRPLVTFEYLQIDDGYQSAIGDWLKPNSKFPRGVDRLAKDIRSAGFAAGIWLAPFIAKRNSQLFAEHPDWFVKNEDQRARFALWNPMWGASACYALDTTRVEVLDWIAHVIDTLVHRWGFTVLKLDFLYAAALPGQRFDSSVTRAEALRRGLEAIRAAAGEKAFLIGCGCPLGPAVGIVDAMRIGPDVAPFWTNFLSRVALRDLHGVATKHAIRNTLTRAFLHRNWWLNDPDCLMIRTSRTQLTEEEFRSLATAVLLTDGLLVFSDRLSHLSEPEIDRLRQVMELRNENRFRAVVPDLMDRNPPSVLLAHSDDQCCLAFLNFDDRASAPRLDLRRWFPQAGKLSHVFEYWTNLVLELDQGVVVLPPVPGHGSRVLTLPPE